MRRKKVHKILRNKSKKHRFYFSSVKTSTSKNKTNRHKTSRKVQGEKKRINTAFSGMRKLKQHSYKQNMIALN